MKWTEEELEFLQNADVDSYAIAAAANTEQIVSRINAITDDLKKERQDREKADQANMEYTKKYNTKMKRLAVSALVVAVLSLIVTIAFSVLPNIEFIERPNAAEDKTTQSDGGQSQQNTDDSE